MKNSFLIPVAVVLILLISMASKTPTTQPVPRPEDTESAVSGFTVASADSLSKPINNQNVNINTFRTISSSKAKERKEKGAIMLDVRIREEYKSFRIEGSISIPLDSLRETMHTALPDKNAEIIVLCDNGIPSKTAYSILTEAGYQNVYYMGSIVMWDYGFVTT